MTPSEQQNNIDADESPQDPNWARSSSGYFHRLATIDTKSIHNQSGVIVIWHAGATPQWVYVNYTDDLAAAFEQAVKNHEIMNFEGHGGLYASWSPMPKEYQPGVVRYMIETLKPLVDNQTTPDTSTKPIPVFAPGARGPAL